MTERMTASLYGFVNPTGQDAGFVVPLFTDPTGGNVLLAQRVGKGDRIRDFQPVEAPTSTTPLHEVRTRRAGQSALWAFQFGDGTYAVDTRAALKKILAEAKGLYREQPFLFLQIVQFCEEASETASALKSAYEYLASHSRKSAEAWRDVVFLPTLARSTLGTLLTPRPRARLLDDVKFDIERHHMSMWLPDKLFDQFHGQDGTPSAFRKIVLEKARGLDIVSLKINRFERKFDGLTARKRDSSGRTVVIPVGERAMSFIKSIGNVPYAKATTKSRPSSIIDQIQFGPATSRLPGVRIGYMKPSKFSQQSVGKVHAGAALSAGPTTLVMFVLSVVELVKENSLAFVKAIASEYRRVNSRTIVLLVHNEIADGPIPHQQYSRAMSYLRKLLDYWVFVRPRPYRGYVRKLSDGDYQEALYGTVDLIHTCAGTNLEEELWKSPGREGMKFAASSVMKSNIGDDIERTSRQLVEQMMGELSVERAESFIGVFDRPRRSQSRLFDSHADLSDSFAGPLRSSYINRPLWPGPKVKRANGWSAALLVGVEFSAAPTKFPLACANILEKNGFKIARSGRGRADFTASYDGERFEIECFWSERPPNNFFREWSASSARRRAIICNWPIPDELAIKSSLEGVWCVSSVNIPLLADAAREPGAILMDLFARMQLRDFRTALNRHIGQFLSRELVGNAERYSLYQNISDLSSHTQLENTLDETVTSIKVVGEEIRINGSMTVEVELNYGKEADDHSSDSYPGTFSLKLTQAGGLEVEDADVDTSSFYE